VQRMWECLLWLSCDPGGIFAAARKSAGVVMI
jgi:hypothetical protein